MHMMDQFYLIKDSYDQNLLWIGVIVYYYKAKKVQTSHTSYNIKNC